MASRMRSAAGILALAGLWGLGGCSSSDRPPPAPPQTEMYGSSVPPATAPPPAHTAATTDLEKLNFSTKEAFEVELPSQSREVEKHYDTLAEKQGWVKKMPRRPTDPGARKWISTGARVGPTDAYDAAWEDPKSGEVAVLNLWHVAGEEKRQHGTFEVFSKEQSPFSVP